MTRAMYIYVICIIYTIFCIRCYMRYTPSSTTHFLVGLMSKTFPELDFLLSKLSLNPSIQHVQNNNVMGRILIQIWLIMSSFLKKILRHMISYNCMYCSILQRMCKAYLLCQVLTLNRKKLLTMRQIQFGQMSKEGMANWYTNNIYSTIL